VNHSKSKGGHPLLAQTTVGLRNQKQGSVEGKFKWPCWIGRPRKPYLRTKNYESILYIAEVMTVDHLHPGRSVGRWSLVVGRRSVLIIH